MRIEPVLIRALLPIEETDNIILKNVISLKNEPKIIRPIELIPYEKKFICADGHHRVLSRIARNEEGILARILESDLEVEESFEGILYDLRTLKEVKRMYTDYFQPLCKKEGILNFYDYKILNILRVLNG